MSLDLTEEAARLALAHPADAVEEINDQPVAEAARLLDSMDYSAAVAVFDQAGLERPAELIGAMPFEKAALLLAGVAPDQRAEIFRKLPAEVGERLMSQLNAETRDELQRLLVWPPETAGGVMTTQFLRIPVESAVGQALDIVRASPPAIETVYALYVVNGNGVLVKAISLRDLVTSDPSAPVASVGSNRKSFSVKPGEPLKNVQRLISKYDLTAAPVLDDEGRVIGIVTVDDVIDAIVEQDTRETQHMGGLEALGAPYMATSFFSMIRKRAGWLCALFLSEMLTASAMQHYESELEKAVVLTLFIPLIMSSGGNSGSQATSLIIRALALGELKLRDWWRVALREAPSGIVLGAILGVIGAIRITIWQKFGLFDYGEHWVLIAFTIGAALVGIVAFGSLAGSMLPFALQRLGFDPASASAPFVATLVDVTGLVIYFSIAFVILRGTLL
jgi:magnesium transporter